MNKLRFIIVCVLIGRFLALPIWGQPTPPITGALNVNKTTGLITGNAFTLADFKTANSIGGGGSGDVVGPASATDNAIVRFDLTTGKLIQNSAVTMADTTGAMTWAANQSASLRGGSSGATLTIGQGSSGTVSATYPDGESLFFFDVSGTRAGTFFGYKTGKGNAGDNNTGFGNWALGSASTGTANAAFGFGALRANTSGYYNSAFGSGTLLNNTSGLGNTGMGESSLADATTANNNTAFGMDTLRTTTTGGNNVGVGVSALYFNTTGSNNVALGVQSLEHVTTAQFNTSVGNGALSTHTTGGQNTALGYQAGLATTTGSGNVFIGNEVAKTHTTGNRNVLLGNTIEPPSITDSNQLVISNAIYGFSMDGEGTTASTGRIRIGNSSDNGSDKFQVAGSVAFQGVSGSAITYGYQNGNIFNSLFVADGASSSTDARFGFRPLGSTTVPGIRFALLGTTQAEIDAGTFDAAGAFAAAKTMALNASGGNVTLSASGTGNVVSALGTGGATSGVTGALRSAGGIGAAENIAAGGLLIAGSGPTTLTDATGKILSAALNTVAVGQGGTGLTSGTSGGVPYYSSSSAITSSAALASGNIVLGGGAGAAPATTATGTGVVTALGVNTGSAGAFQVNNASGAALTSLTAANISAGALANGMTATTQAAGNNTTSLATTAFVTTAVANAVGQAEKIAVFSVDGAGAAITTGTISGTSTSANAFTLTGWSISATAASGTITVKIWNKAYSTAIPTISNVINTSGISLSSGTAIYSTTLSDFTDTSFAAQDQFRCAITAVDGAATDLTVTLYGTRL